MLKNNLLAKSVRFALIGGAATAALTAAPVIAAEEGEDKVERIEVTGSRIKRTDVETSSPIVSFSASQIAETGLQNVEDILNSLPQLETAANSQTSNGASGVATLDLRGMGSNRTVVLINGRRLQPGGVYSQSPDVNQIPAALIKRVDILTGGASSVYGADAIAGVVNFIMNDEFEGVKLGIHASGYQHNNDNKYIQNLMDERGFEYDDGNTGIDGETYSLDLTMGGEFNDGKGHATVYATWKRSNAVLQGQRDYSSCALNNAGTSCGGSQNAVIPNFYFYPVIDGAVDYTQEKLWTLGDGTDGFVEYDNNLYNFAPINHFARPDERFTLGAFVDYEINDSTKAYFEVSMMNDNTDAQIAESGTFFNEEYRLNFENPLLSDTQKQQLMDLYGLDKDGEFVAYIGKRNVEGGPRASLLEHTSFRIVTGLEGEINDLWSYDVSYQHGQTSSTAGYVNDFFAPRIGNSIYALGSEGCGDGCTPYEVFTYNGVTPEQASTLTGTAVLRGKTTQTVYNGYVTGEFEFGLPSSDENVGAVLGFERRETVFERIADEVYSQNLLLGQGGATNNILGEFDVNEVFSELRIPLVSDVPLMESVALDLGGRYSDYNTTGSEFTYKVAVDWALTNDWKLRVSYNKATRAPNISELFVSQSKGLFDGTDPCAGDNPQATAERCALTGVSSAQYGNISKSPADQYNNFGGGNPELQPEDGKTFTVGLVANPFEGFDFTVDYWDIKLENTIGTIGEQTIIDGCLLNGIDDFCQYVQRSAAGSLWLGEEGRVIDLSNNVGDRQFKGVDLSANYLMDLANGSLAIGLTGSYNLKKEISPLSSLPELKYDCSGDVSDRCFAQPKWRHTLSAKYSVDDWSVGLKWRYFGGVDYTSQNQVDTLAQGGVASQSYFDVTGRYQLTENISLGGGINNIFDKEPPLVGGTLKTNGNQIAGFYDSLGRFLHADIVIKF